MKINFTKKSFFKSSKGFTLLELLVVIAIIAIMTAIVLAVLGSAKDKGADGAIKSNLSNARSQAEVFYNTNTTAPGSYTAVCSQVAVVGGAKTLFTAMTAAYKAAGLGSYAYNNVGAVGTATCNSTANAWAAEVPLKGSGVNQMWCVDSTGKSKQESSVSISGGYACP